VPVNKKQLQRLIRLVGELKENRHPNCQRFAQSLKDSDLSCTAKTILRDIKLLKDDFDCPIDFDEKYNGYYLQHHGWNFDVPYHFGDQEMLATVIGSRVAEQIFPEPLRSQIRDAVDKQLTNYNPDFLDSLIVPSISITSNLLAEISPEIFMTVFDAWQKHEALLIKYSDQEDNITERKIEPHLLCFYNQTWYLKSKCLRKNEYRSFVLCRIQSAERLGKFFEPDIDLIKDSCQDNIFQTEILNDVELLCTRNIKNILLASPLHRQQNIKTKNADEFILTLPQISKQRLIRWIMEHCGGAALISHPHVQKEIAALAEKLRKIHSTH